MVKGSFEKGGRAEMTGEKSTHIGGSDNLVKAFRQWIASLSPGRPMAGSAIVLFPIHQPSTLAPYWKRLVRSYGLEA